MPEKDGHVVQIGRPVAKPLEIEVLEKFKKYDSRYTEDRKALFPDIAGDEISFCYHGTLERSRQARAALFRQQHLVDLVPSRLPSTELEALAQNVDAEVVVRTILGIETALDRIEAYIKNDAAVKGVAAMSDLEAILAYASQYLAPRHLVLCRIRRLWSRAAREVLSASPDADVAEKLVHMLHEVRATQALFLPPTHLQVAESADDLAAGISVLLSNNRARLFSSCHEYYGTLSRAAGEVARLQQEANTIRKLYDRTEVSAGSGLGSNEEEALPRQVEGTRTLAAQHATASEDWSIFD